MSDNTTVRYEVDMSKPVSQEQKDDKDFARSGIDLTDLCKKLHLQWFSYREYYPGQEKTPEKDREYRLAHFIHEAGIHHSETGLKFYSKRDMAENICNFSIHQMAFPDANLVHWGGARGIRVSTTMSPERMKEVQARRASIEALQASVEKGELENVKAGVTKLRATDL